MECCKQEILKVLKIIVSGISTLKIIKITLTSKKYEKETVLLEKPLKVEFRKV